MVRRHLALHVLVGTDTSSGQKEALEAYSQGRPDLVVSGRLKSEDGVGRLRPVHIRAIRNSGSFIDGIVEGLSCVQTSKDAQTRSTTWKVKCGKSYACRSINAKLEARFLGGCMALQHEENDVAITDGNKCWDGGTSDMPLSTDASRTCSRYSK